MTVPGPAIVDQATLDWEGGEDADLATGSGIRWKLLIAGESTQSVGLITGIAEITPGAELMRHHHEPAETYYIMSGRGEMEIEGRTQARWGPAAPSTSRRTPSMPSAAPARSRWSSCSPSRATASTRSSTTSIIST